MPAPSLAELRDLVEQAAAERTDPRDQSLLRSVADMIDQIRLQDEGKATAAGAQLVQLPPEAFRSLLRSRRKAAGMSLRQLAQRCQIAPNTIRNIESGRTSASEATAARLASVPELGLLDPSATSHAGPRAHAYFCESYDRRALVAEMQKLLNQPGGRLEQTSLYLDDLSASDYLAVTSAPAFQERFRSLPLDAVARSVLESTRGAPIDLVALGPGDGRSETELCKRLLEHGSALSLRVLLLDISHTFLNNAYIRAREELPGRVSVEALHGDFRQIGRYPVLHRNVAPRHRRVYTLLGGTLANVDNEVLFIRDGLAQSQPGDLAVVDFQCAWADRRDPAAVRAADPTLQGPPPELHARWFTGPLRRYGTGIDGIKVGVELLTDCLIEGSYELDCYADATRGKDVHRYHLFRVRRYEPAALLATFQRQGWEAVQCLRYGPSEMSAVAVLRRQ
jgi:transcriptional regulator with XRE-family HTH domain